MGYPPEKIMIELRTYDVYITEIVDKQTNEKKEVVRLKSSLAFDETFISELKLEGVKKYIDENED